MIFNPMGFGHLSPSQEAIVRYLANGRRWRTPNEVAVRTGFRRGAVRKVIQHLFRLGLVSRRKRQGGFENGLFEYYRETKLRSLAQRRRERENAYRRAGVEPLERTLLRRIGLKHTRELFGPRETATPQQSDQKPVPRETTQP